MPRINILKVDKPICEDCGKEIKDNVYCVITTATNKEIKMHRECIIDFAVSILEECSKDEHLKELVDTKCKEVLNKVTLQKCEVKGEKKETPKEDIVYDEDEELIGYGIINNRTCRECISYYITSNVGRPYCSRPTCSKRDGL